MSFPGSKALKNVLNCNLKFSPWRRLVKKVNKVSAGEILSLSFRLFSPQWFRILLFISKGVSDSNPGSCKPQAQAQAWAQVWSAKRFGLCEKLQKSVREISCDHQKSKGVYDSNTERLAPSLQMGADPNLKPTIGRQSDRSTCLSKTNNKSKSSSVLTISREYLEKFKPNYSQTLMSLNLLSNTSEKVYSFSNSSSIQSNGVKSIVRNSETLRLQLEKPNLKSKLPPMSTANVSFCFSKIDTWSKTRVISLAGDIEENPGPHGSVNPGAAPGANVAKQAECRVTSYNVRGLGDEKKLRHLINFCYQNKAGKNRDDIFCFQEVFIEGPGKIPYLWRGNFHLTPGTGNSQGCLTLLSSHLNIIEARNIGSRAHVLAIQKAGDSSTSYILINLYAPNPNNEAKADFFHSIFDVAREFELKYNCEATLVAGDFNLVFKLSETKNRAISNPERLIANSVKQMWTDSALSDLWEINPLFTWRRPNSECFSAIDRILYRKSELETSRVKINWALSFSDHGAIEAEFVKPLKRHRPKSRLPRLDPTLISDPLTKELITTEFETLWSQMSPSWNPHVKLDYAKMCIRTVTEKIQAERKRKELSEEEMLNLELQIAIASLEKGEGGNALIDYIEELRLRKQILVEAKGERLAERLGTKWYSEGELSNRYFLRLLNRGVPDDFKQIQNDRGETLLDEDLIEEEIVSFYRKLYEDYDDSIIDTSADNNFFDLISGVNDQAADAAANSISLAELQATLVGCSDSAPGPDGIPYSYIRALWKHLGPLIVEAWNFSLVTGNLCPSHKQSFLKLIPKAGKDSTKLTNWRPITLSNCDHKLITKTYSRRLSECLAEKIKERQTAYIKGRMINDNIRALLSTVELANNEDAVDGLIVSLDAKKAFDSVDHNYIEKCLQKFGLRRFVPIFRILYKDLYTDIIINGRIVKGFKILRGVKQGDALSCILFIMCMEPLLLNLENNANIEPIYSVLLEQNFPKAYAYADDVNLAIRNDHRCIQGVFDEYERLTKCSGLELNADKTEILRFASSQVNRVETSHEVRYSGNEYKLTTKGEIKINGILFQQDADLMKNSNVEAVLRKMEKQLQKWSTRRLSTLGKILIVKTFGISQITFLLQSLKLNLADFKRVNALLFRFIWNRNFQAAKAPERIRREIMNKSIKLGGYGMLDLIEMDKSLKLRALGRVLDSKHPFMVMARDGLDLSSFFFPKVLKKVDPILTFATELLGHDRRKIWETPREELGCSELKLIKEVKLQDCVSPVGKNSILYFVLRRRGITSLGQLNLNELDQLSRFMNRNLAEKIREIHALDLNQIAISSDGLTFLNKKLVKLSTLSSKMIRDGRANSEPICLFKSGLILDPSESLNWSTRISKITCVKHRNILLRVAHKELYTKEKLYRFNLINSPQCPRCDEIEDFNHRLMDCEYVKRIWDETLKISAKLNQGGRPGLDRLSQILGGGIENTVATMTLHAEILSRILQLKDDSRYLIRPKIMVEMALRFLIKREKGKVKNSLMAV